MSKKEVLAALTGAASLKGNKDEYKFLEGKSVEDVLESPTFNRILAEKLKKMNNYRLMNGDFKGHHIGTLITMGCWETGKFKNLYKQVINKECSLPSRLRMFISIVGSDAYVDTINRLKAKNKRK